MPQSSRAQRRRQVRGGSATPPPRDPMRAIYIGVGILIVAVVATFGFIRWQQNQAVATAFASPPPAASPTSKPIALTDGENIGTPYFKAKVPDTAQGGHGQPVDGITCESMEGANLHIHTHLAMFYRGKQLQIPRFVGFTANTSMPGGGCLYWIHTHFTDGIIHVESPDVVPPQGGSHYTLGNFFDIWGQPLTRSEIAGLKGPVTAFVDGEKYDGDLASIPLMSHQQIVLEIGTPVVPPPNYAFPPND